MSTLSDLFAKEQAAKAKKETKKAPKKETK